jgi:uncharacterized protein YoxC
MQMLIVMAMVVVMVMVVLTLHKVTRIQKHVVIRVDGAESKETGDSRRSQKI